MKEFYSDRNQNKIERYSIVLFSLYTFAITALSVQRKDNPWIGILLTCACLVMWVLYVGKVKTYRYRTTFYTVTMQVILLLHAIRLKDIGRVIPVVMVFTVVVSLYGILELLYVPMIGTLLIFVGTTLIQDLLLRHTTATLSNAIFITLNAGLLERIMYTSTRRSRERNRHLMNAIEELERAEKSKDDFLANVSHEIRTPLNTICGMSELMLRQEQDEQVLEQIQSIHVSGRMLMSVVGDILDFSELVSGHMELEEETYNITTTLSEVMKMAYVRKGDKPIELIVNCDADIPSALYGDEKKLRRVMQNLVDNAIKFTEEGCVTLSLRCRRELYGINLMVQVKDTGIGMDDKNQEKLFKVFSQADAGRNRQNEGVGLGLAISRALVEKMGGAIMVKSRAGKGTVIKFTIPVKVLDETPIASIYNRAGLNVAVYVDMEQFIMEMVRDEYSRCIADIMEQLNGKCHLCRNLAELQRREQREKLSHVFISVTEYMANRGYFDELARKMKVAVIAERSYAAEITDRNVIRIYKPWNLYTIVSVLNGNYVDTEEREALSEGKLTARDVRALIVDDNRMNLMVMEALLATYHISSTVVTSGIQALEKIASKEYDFVFMDHMMPDMDGVEALHRIRQMGGKYFQSVPVIAVTANAVAGARDMFLAEGFQDFIEKPVERVVLERLLRRVIPPEKLSSVTEQEATGENRESSKNWKEGLKDSENVSGEWEKSIPQRLEKYGIDAVRGMMYCNGRDAYIGILRKICQDSEDPSVLANRLFHEKSWKDYTIAVHGIKGAMKSIGANKLSELAKELEFAGKDGQISFIMEHHEAFIREYQGLMKGLRSEAWLKEERETDERPPAECRELSEAEFDAKIKQMEHAVYSLNEQLLKDILKELKASGYCGVLLSHELSPIEKKVESASYMSAVELLAALKESLEKNRREGNVEKTDR